MDTSEQYIKMCEKAKEIQGIPRHPEKPHLNYRSSACFIHQGGRLWYIRGREHEDSNDYIWLPTQDQLQEMMGDFKTCIKLAAGVSLVNQGIIYEVGGYKYCHQFTSMEQLWLAFVMGEKYNKVWDGHNWKEVK